MTKEERIRSVYKHLKSSNKVTQKDFASAIGVSQQMMSEVLKGGKNAGEKILLGIIDNYKINPLWLLRGEGEMFNQEAVLNEPSAEYEKTAPLNEDAVVDYLIKNTDNLMKNPTFKFWYNYIREKVKNEILIELRSSV